MAGRRITIDEKIERQMDAFVRSDRIYDEIMEFLKSGPNGA